VQLYLLNPLADLFEQFRHAIIDPTAPSAAAAMGGWALLLIPIGIVAITCLAGFTVFNRMAPHIAEDL
jgi:ABC-2 type transport system permease protein